MISHLIFDLDGTLVDSITDIYQAHLKTMDYYKLSQNLTYDQLKSFIGPGLPFLIDYVVSGSCVTADLYREKFREHYRKQLTEHTRLYEGFRSLLTELSEKVVMSVLTNKAEESAILLLKQLQADHFFKKIAGPDTYQSHKPDPQGIIRLNEELGFSNQETLMIGDTQNDIKAAKLAQVHSMGVTWGYEQNIHDLNPDYVVHSVQDLAHVLKGLLS